MSACPQCGKSVKAGQSICEHCDFIIDDSFLGDGTGMRGKVAAPVPPPAAAEKRVERDVHAVEKPGSRVDPTLGSQALAETEQILNQSWREFQMMNKLDRWTIAAGLALFIFTALPWRDSPSGADLGVSLGAWPASLFGIGAAVLTYLRQSVLPSKWRAHALNAQLALGVLSALICVYRLIADTNFTLIEARGYTVYTSTPSFGVFLALAAAVAIAVSSFYAKRASPVIR